MNPLLAQTQNALRFLMSHERVFVLACGVIIGIVTGFGAIGMTRLIEALGEGFDYLHCLSEGWSGYAWPSMVLMPALGGLIIGPIIYRFAREAKGHGVPEVMAAVIQGGGFIRPRVALVKVFASAVCIASGGSVGREGPIVQIGSTLGSITGFLMHVPPRLMRLFVACGAAGGIAATFNAPIAGALFAVEIILGDFGFIQLAPIVTSSVVATVISRSVMGDFAAFQVASYEMAHPIEMIPYVGLGLLCGVGAVGFIRLMDALDGIFDYKVKLPEPIKPALGGLLIGFIGLAFPQIFGLGYETIDLALHDRMPMLLMGALVLAKMLATSLTLGSGGSGGIFAPSLFMGAMTGGVVGKISNLLLPHMSASSGAYAMVGMAAMVGATTHAPITAIVIIFELTNDYKIILPLMISTIIAVITASAMYRESIYTDKLRRKGVNIQRGLEPNVLKKVKARDIMKTDFDAAPRDLPLNFLADLVMESSHSQIPVLDAEGRIEGVVSRNAVKKILFNKDVLSDVVIAGDLIKGEYPVLLQDETADLAMLRFHEFRSHELYVLDSLEHRKLIGVLRKEDLMDAYHREMARQSSGDVFAYSINRPHRMESVDVMDGYGIIEVEAPHDFTGKPLRELDLRNRFGVTILAIKRSEPGEGAPQLRVWVPESNDRIEDGDVLVLLGEQEKIADFFDRL